MENETIQNIEQSIESRENKTNKKKIIIYTIIVLCFALFFYHFLLSAPKSFPVGSMINLDQGSSLRSISLELKNRSIIRSRTAFEAFVIILGREKHVIAGDYYFENKLPVYLVAMRIAKGEHHIAPISITIPEGFDNDEIAEAFALKLNYFNKNKFILNAKDKQGILFPDTYFFLSTDNEDKVLSSMSKNFEKKFAPLRKDISGKTDREIIIMASIIEREAKGNGDREIISGILWRRLANGMPLQVDAAPDTYKTKGLPANPICNPGLDSIKAAIYVLKMHNLPPYLYYLHDKNGTIHYAKTFAEHNANIKKYLR
jgi:UPF0755 protein